MQSLPPVDLMQRALRVRICDRCPNGQRGLSPLQPQACQEHCPLFRYLPALAMVSRMVELGREHEGLIRETICQQCTLSDTAGDFCQERALRRCPLSLFSGEALDVLQKTLQAYRKRPAQQVGQPA